MIITTPHDLPADKPRKRSCGGGFLKNLETFHIEEAMIITTPHDLPADKPRKRSCGVALVIAFDVYCYAYI
jgi:single-stranded DNA-specific DHH superfamily exonuclease